jgi:hypothetical protein
MSLEVNQTTVDELRVAYQAARGSNHESFTFRDELLLTDYAKYLIEYMETQISLT